MKSQFTLDELSTKLTLECGKLNLAYSIGIQPVKVGPDCYMFYATALDYNCRKHGQCRYQPYYALTGGNVIQILDADRNELHNESEVV